MQDKMTDDKAIEGEEGPMSIGLIYKNNDHVIEEKVKEGVPFLSYPILENTGIVSHGFSTRLGGVSEGGYSSMNLSLSRGDSPEAVEENTKRIARAIGVEKEKMVYTQQTHTTNVAVVSGKDAGSTLKETDGLVTNSPGICLVTFYADCVPLYFVDPVRRAIGLSHSGWRGTVGKMAAATVEKMKECFGTRPEDIIAAVGPSICQDCYEVSEDVTSRFKETFREEDWKDLFYKKENGKFQLDLWKANEINLQEAGVLPEHIAVTNVCTCCNPKILFSHRVQGWNRGNLCAFLALKDKE